jgi:SAM-dependent methyltransferase
MDDKTPLQKLNPRDRFSDRAADYAKYRPSYPKDAIDCILARLNSPLVAADIGAGTGIASRLLAQRGVKVNAIEPNEPMRQAALPHPLVEFQDGTAETTNLPDASVDLVTCFQSFHWFDRRKAIAEFRRILKPSGRLALVWNIYDLTDKFTASYGRLICRASFSNPLRYFYESTIAPSELAMHWREWQLSPILRRHNFTSIRCDGFPNEQALNLTELLGLTMSFSHVPLSGMAHQKLVDNVKQLCDRDYDEHGKVRLTYTARVYRCQVKNG